MFVVFPNKHPICICAPGGVGAFTINGNIQPQTGRTQKLNDNCERKKEFLPFPRRQKYFIQVRKINQQVKYNERKKKPIKGGV
jgi:hypothetical protein